jgi:hypothetical protein
MARQRNEWADTLRLQTPVGVAVYPYIRKPRPAEGNAPAQYEAALRFDPGDPDFQAFQSKLQAHAEQAREDEGWGDTRIRLPIVEEEDEAGEATGMVLLRTKLPAETNDGVAQRPAVYRADPGLGPYPKDQVPPIGGGSRLILGVDFTPMKGSASILKEKGEIIFVTARVKTVQIIELVRFGEANAASYGLTKHDGYMGDEDEPAAKVDSLEEDFA